MPTTRLRVLGNIGPEHLAALKAGARRLSIRLGLDGSEAPEVVFAWDPENSALAELLARYGDAIRWVHGRRVGLAMPLLRLLDQYPRLTMTTGSGASGPAIAEYVLAVTLALYRRLPELHERQRAAEWVRGFQVTELRGQTVCIIGLGDLGRSIARVMRPLGVRLLGIRRHERSVPEVDETHPPGALLTLLERSNLLVLAAPVTPETRQLVGAEALSRLPRGSYLVNVGRGALLDEAALGEALRSGQLAGAALDVFAEEPLPPTSPLWSLPNLIVTPHTSTHTLENDERSLTLFLDNLERFRRGEALRNVVDRSRGY
jgi:phosphoglycerate dehydrogenase-like enzyme